MSEEALEYRPFPRGALLGAGTLVAMALVAAAAGSLTGFGTVALPASDPVASYALRFEDRADGSVAVYDAAGLREVDVIDPGTNGFVRGVLRGLARERKRQAIGQDLPFRLTRWADGRLSIEDPTTGQWVDLGAFGPTNSGAFARILDAAGGGAS